jgi:hypothetical protein
MIILQIQHMFKRIMTTYFQIRSFYVILLSNTKKNRFGIFQNCKQTYLKK